MSNTLIQLNNCGILRNQKWLVRGVSLKVDRGQIVTLIGPNGSGKSTTAKMALGILRPDEGSNIVLNNLNNITAIQKGLGAENKIMCVPKIDYNISNDFGEVTLQDNGGDAIDVITIDSLQLDKLDFLKLDIKGMEIDALNGAKKTLDKFRLGCWIRYCKYDLLEIKKIFAFLDYTLYKVDDENLVAAPNKTTFPWMKEKIE